MCAYAGDGCGTSIPSLFPGGLPFTRRDQTAQAVVDIKTPRARTVTVTFEGRNQADVRKAEFGLVAFPGDLKDNVSAFPLGLVLDKVK